MRKALVPAFMMLFPLFFPIPGGVVKDSFPEMPAKDKPAKN